MDTNTIIGAAIAIISSSITAGLSFLFRCLESDKKRKWEIEDRNKENEQKVTIKRIDQVESLVTEYYNLGGTIVRNLDGIYEGNWDYKTLIKEVDPLIKKFHLTQMPKVLGDSKLQTHVDKLHKLSEKIVDLVSIISVNSKDKKLDRREVGEEILKVLNELEEPYSNAIRRLDTLRKNIYS